MKVLQSISRLYKSSDNAFIPVNPHIRPRTRSSITIWHLPEEIIFNLLKHLHIQDLLNMRTVHPQFRDMIDKYTSLWSSVRFHDCWPSQQNLTHFERAAQHGNIEALVKLAVAFLYREGFSEFDSNSFTEHGCNAAKLFCQIESITPNTTPFTWLFFRPPWVTGTACSKEFVFNAMKEHLKVDANCDIAMCVAKSLELLDGPEAYAECTKYLQTAASSGSRDAAYLHWQRSYSQVINDKAAQLESIRQLRDIANTGFHEARMALAKLYAAGHYGNISPVQAAQFMRDLFQCSSPSGIHHIFTSFRDPTPSMRYILVDWLVEVSGMKDFATVTLHASVSLVDRFLQIHTVPRSKLQLLGVAAIVICSRFLGNDIITIREAAWLTDNTYKYEDVVRMIGEITASLKGQIRVPVGLDYVELLNLMVGSDRKTIVLSQYICELCLLQAEMGQYSPTEIGTSSVLLARLLMKNECPWPSHVEQQTGFSLEDISRCAFHIHEKCFLEGSVVDHRDITLQSVKQRYSNETYFEVADIEIMTYEELCRMLGVTEHLMHGVDVKLRFRNADELIVSPSRGKSRNYRTIKRSCEREKAATPTIEHDSSSFFEDVKMAGYEGDQEDEGDVFMDTVDSISNSTGSSESSDLTIDWDSDTYSACLSSFCQSGSGNIHMSIASSHDNSRSSSNCACDLTNTSSSSSGISPGFSSSGGHSPSKRPKSSFLSIDSAFNNDTNSKSSFSCEDSPCIDNKNKIGKSERCFFVSDHQSLKKSFRSVTQMTSPNALRRKCRRSSRNATPL